MHATARQKNLLRLVTQGDRASLPKWDRNRRGNLVFDLFFDFPYIYAQPFQDLHGIGFTVTEDAEEEMVRGGYVTAQPRGFLQRIVEHDFHFIGISTVHIFFHAFSF